MNYRKRRWIEYAALRLIQFGKLRFPVIVLTIWFPLLSLCNESVPTEKEHATLLAILLDNRIIEYEQLESLTTRADVRYLVNAIYAKHGYTFKNPTVRAQFHRLSWYAPRSDSVDHLFTESDRANLTTLLFFEQRFIIAEYMQATHPEFSDPLSPLEQSLVGIWQASPVMAAGWSHSYAFYENRAVVERPNQMNCEDRALYRVGFWRVRDGHLRILYVAEGKLTGGELVPATGSCGPEFELQGALPTNQQLSPAVSEKINISPVEPPRDFPHPRVYLQNEAYYKHRSDPTDYE